jgi:hypothetical protein
MRAWYLALAFTVSGTHHANTRQPPEWRRIISAQGREYLYDGKRVTRAAPDVYSVWFQENLTQADTLTVGGRRYVRVEALRQLDCARNRISSALHAIYYDDGGSAIEETQVAAPATDLSWRDATYGTIDGALLDVVCAEAPALAAKQGRGSGHDTGT